MVQWNWLTEACKICYYHQEVDGGEEGYAEWILGESSLMDT